MLERMHAVVQQAFGGPEVLEVAEVDRPVPPGLSHAEAAALPLAGLTAWQSLVDTAQLAAGQRVLIHGAGGGVGHLAVQIAKARGAYVVGTASAAKHEFVRSLGADERSTTRRATSRLWSATWTWCSTL